MKKLLITACLTMVSFQSFAACMDIGTQPKFGQLCEGVHTINILGSLHNFPVEEVFVKRDGQKMVGVMSGGQMSYRKIQNIYTHSRGSALLLDADGENIEAGDNVENIKTGEAGEVMGVNFYNKGLLVKVGLKTVHMKAKDVVFFNGSVGSGFKVKRGCLIDRSNHVKVCEGDGVFLGYGQTPGFEYEVLDVFRNGNLQIKSGGKLSEVPASNFFYTSFMRDAKVGSVRIGDNVKYEKSANRWRNGVVIAANPYKNLVLVQPNSSGSIKDTVAVKVENIRKRGSFDF